MFCIENCALESTVCYSCVSSGHVRYTQDSGIYPFTSALTSRPHDYALYSCVLPDFGRNTRVLLIHSRVAYSGARTHGARSDASRTILYDFTRVRVPSSEEPVQNASSMTLYQEVP